MPALVSELRKELRTLTLRHNEIRRRIYDIQRVVRGLQEMASDADADRTRGARPHRSLNNTKSSVHPRSSDARYKASRVSVSLLRACRIAMMEGSTSASLEEIYERIIRRGSFSFVNQFRASSTLLRVLRCMVDEGEVRLLNAGSSSRWERIHPNPEDVPVTAHQLPSPDIRPGMQYGREEPRLSNDLG
jgi:hypothetical protein